MLSGSLREPGTAPPRSPEFVPRPVSLTSYDRAFEFVDLARYAVNSLLVALLTVPAAVLVASWAGFAILLLAGRARAVLVGLSFVALMVPVTALLVPRFALYRWLGVTDTWVPLVAPALIGLSPFYVLLFYWSFRRLPSEMFEAAWLEGATPLFGAGSRCHWFDPSP
jgi:multiple sugar transport system permease protein